MRCASCTGRPRRRAPEAPDIATIDPPQATGAGPDAAPNFTNPWTSWLRAGERRRRNCPWRCLSGRSARAARSWPRMSASVVRGLIVHRRATVRPFRTVRARRGEAVGHRRAAPSRRSARRRGPSRRKQTIARQAGETTSQPGRSRSSASACSASAIPRAIAARNASSPNTCSESQSFSARLERVSCGPRSRNSTTAAARCRAGRRRRARTCARAGPARGRGRRRSRRAGRATCAGPGRASRRARCRSAGRARASVRRAGAP